mmetsp:Transcript_148229/g.385223  ORF Transcript_148229/g.385223 Transcript_148229/m.385223 type:complete len:279 (-) Transcript_148229:92-928(-)
MRPFSAHTSTCLSVWITFAGGHTPQPAIVEADGMAVGSRRCLAVDTTARGIQPVLRNIFTIRPSTPLLRSAALTSAWSTVSIALKRDDVHRQAFGAQALAISLGCLKRVGTDDGHTLFVGLHHDLEGITLLQQANGHQAPRYEFSLVERVVEEQQPVLIGLFLFCILLHLGARDGYGGLNRCFPHRKVHGPPPGTSLPALPGCRSGSDSEGSNAYSCRPRRCTHVCRCRSCERWRNIRAGRGQSSGPHTRQRGGGRERDEESLRRLHRWPRRNCHDPS